MQEGAQTLDLSFNCLGPGTVVERMLAIVAARPLCNVRNLVLAGVPLTPVALGDVASLVRSAPSLRSVTISGASREWAER